MTRIGFGATLEADGCSVRHRVHVDPAIASVSYLFSTCLHSWATQRRLAVGRAKARSRMRTPMCNSLCRVCRHLPRCGMVHLLIAFSSSRRRVLLSIRKPSGFVSNLFRREWREERREKREEREEKRVADLRAYNGIGGAQKC